MIISWHHFADGSNKTISIPVFSYKDVVNEEISIDGDVLCVTKMIKICNAMMEVVSKNQFEWMVFSTDSLPMEVSSFIKKVLSHQSYVLL